jgi:DNA-directed RNA polymerase subunit RPC12/RpoP
MIHLITGDPIDLRNINEELGDAQWYIPIGANAIGTTLEQVQVDNYVKLDKKRYSSGKFNAEEADPANRDTEHEVSHIKAEKVVQTKTVIACPHCNAQFTEPEDDRGGPPRPDDEIQCPDCKRMYPAHKFMSVVPRHPITIEASDKVMSTPYATSDVVILQPGYEDQHEPFLYTCHACGQRTDVACAMERLLQGQIIGCPMCGETIKLPVKQG